MDIVSLFAVISSIILLGYISGYIFKKTGIPDVLILIGVGVVIRYGFKWLDPENLGAGSSVFTTFALIFLLFQGALNIDIKTLFESLSYVLKLTILHFILSLGVIFGIVFFISGSVPASLIAAFILAGTSSAVVIPLINNIDIKERYGTILTMESAITDVLCIIGVLTLVRIFSPGSGVLPSEIFRSVLVSFALAIFVGVIIGYFWVLLLSKHEDLISAHILTIGIVMGVYAFVQSPLVSGSGAIAALTFGIVLGNSRSILKFRYRKKNKAIEARAAKVRSVKKKERILDRKISHNV
ncbi:MAG: cation:proton antiporter, partial [Nanoarchaeota archaeon]